MIEEHIDPIAEAHDQVSNLLRTLVNSLTNTTDRRARRRQPDQVRPRDQSQARRGELQNRGIDVHMLAGQAAGSGTPVVQTAPGVADQVHRLQGADLAQPPKWPGENDLPRDRRWEAEIMGAAGPEVGAEMIAQKGWPDLQARLDELKDAGKDPSAQLSAAIGNDKLRTALDKASALRYRLGHLEDDRQSLHRPAGTHINQSDPERLAQRQRANRERGQDGLEPGADS